MRTFTRLALLAGGAIFSQMALASINYNVLDANIAYSNGDTTTLTSATNGNAITFTANPGMTVGDGSSSGHNAAVVTIIYTVTSTTRINGLDLIFTGQASNMGQLGYSELVENWSQNGGSGSVLASTNGVYKGSGFSGGSDNSFTNETMLNFGQSVFSYKVKKTFTLTDLDSNPSNSAVTLGFVEQNAVPEPASMAALAMGGLGLIARKRRKK